MDGEEFIFSRSFCGNVYSLSGTIGAISGFISHLRPLFRISLTSPLKTIKMGKTQRRVYLYPTD